MHHYVFIIFVSAWKYNLNKSGEERLNFEMPAFQLCDPVLVSTDLQVKLEDCTNYSNKLKMKVSRGHAHCKISCKYCIFLVPYTFYHHGTQNDNTN